MTTLQFLLILTPFLLAIGLLVFLLHKQMMLNATTADALRTETIKYAEAINEVQVFSERNARLIEENANHERKLVALATDFDEYKYNYKNVSTALNEWIKKYESLESERVMTQGQAEQLQNLLADYRLKFANLEETNRDLAHQLTKYEAKPLTDAIQTLKNEVNGATNKYEEGCINTIKFIRDELQKEIDNYEESAGRAISKKHRN
jgi:chromosome segregation ATPase